MWLLTKWSLQTLFLLALIGTSVSFKCYVYQGSPQPTEDFCDDSNGNHNNKTEDCPTPGASQINGCTTHRIDGSATCIIQECVLLPSSTKEPVPPEYTDSTQNVRVYTCLTELCNNGAVHGKDGNNLNGTVSGSTGNGATSSPGNGGNGQGASLYLRNSRARAVGCVMILLITNYHP